MCPVRLSLSSPCPCSLSFFAARSSALSSRLAPPAASAPLLRPLRSSPSPLSARPCCPCFVRCLPHAHLPGLPSLLLHTCISRRSHFAQGRLFLRLFVAVPWITSSLGHSLLALSLPSRPLLPRSPRCVVATHGGSSISPCVSIPASAGNLQLSFPRCSLPWSPGQCPCLRPWGKDSCGRRSSSALAAAPPPPPPCGLSCPRPSSKAGSVFLPSTGFSSPSLSARRIASRLSSPSTFTTWSVWPSTADALASLPRLLLLSLPRPPRRLLLLLQRLLLLQQPPRLLSLRRRLPLRQRHPLTLTLPLAAPVTPHLRKNGSGHVLPAVPFPLAVLLPVPLTSPCGRPPEMVTPSVSPPAFETSGSVTLTTRGVDGRPCTWQLRGTTPRSFASS